MPGNDQIVGETLSHRPVTGPWRRRSLTAARAEAMYRALAAPGSTDEGGGITYRTKLRISFKYEAGQ
jgi:hypothetical protein